MMNMKECLELLYEESINLCNTIDTLVREESLENSLKFLNWQDRLNKISIK